MADDDLLHVRITDGAYTGRYAIDLDDFTASEAGEFRRSVGVPIAAMFATEDVGDIDGIAGLIWLIKRRAAKGLAYGAVADEIRYGNCKVGAAATADEGRVEDPSSPEA